MPHLRERHSLFLLLQKLRFSPVVTIQGARQTGKSTLARDLVAKHLHESQFVSLDDAKTRFVAENQPGIFLETYSDAKPIIIDEAQKAPALFDQIKFEVDRQRRPGRFLLLGSTEFSRELKVREALTGRLTKLRLFPFTLAESLRKKINPSSHPFLLNTLPRISLKELLRYLKNGGMPGIFYTRPEAEREQRFKDWLTLTVERDAMLFPTLRVNPDLCMRSLELIAQLEEPTLAEIAAKTKVPARRIETHLKVLTQLFCIHALKPHPLGTGKTRFYLLDVGLATYLKADFRRLLQTWVLLEQLSQRACRPELKGTLYYYRNTKGSIIDFFIELGPKSIAAMKILTEEKLDLRELEILAALQKKAGAQGIQCQTFALGSQYLKVGDYRTEVFPWMSMG